jgi:hypothetical protein
MRVYIMSMPPLYLCLCYIGVRVIVACFEIGAEVELKMQELDLN